MVWLGLRELCTSLYQELLCLDVTEKGFDQSLISVSHLF